MYKDGRGYGIFCEEICLVLFMFAVTVVIEDNVSYLVKDCSILSLVASINIIIKNKFPAIHLDKEAVCAHLKSLFAFMSR